MKYLKKFEELNRGEPKLNDYIIAYNKDSISQIKNKIGQITNDFPDSHQSTYKTIFDNEIWWINRSDIKYWSENKEDLESMIVINKFNL